MRHRRREPAAADDTVERVVLVVSLIGWAAALAAGVGLIPLAGRLPSGLYPLYGIAAALGWLAGNLYVSRRRRFPQRPIRRRLLVTYLLGPPGLVFLLRALDTERAQIAAPLAATWALGVYAIFFAVPVSLRPRS